MVHAIDLYLEDEPSAYWQSRYQAYRTHLLSNDVLEPVGEVYDGPLAFSCAFASNPDDTMYRWGRIAPQLISLRQKAQSVSLICDFRKRRA
jgi:hypothetical protein